MQGPLTTASTARVCATATACAGISMAITTKASGQVAFEKVAVCSNVQMTQTMSVSGAE